MALRILGIPGLSVLLLQGLAGGAFAAGGAPAQLLGKSVVVTWSETRQQRGVGEANFRTVNASHNLSVYVSGGGRVFSRQTNTTRAGSGSTEQIAGQGGTGAIAARVPSFSGQSLTVFEPRRSGVRRILVDFDAGFSSCSAKVGVATQTGHATNVAFSPITAKYVEVQSVSVGSASCSVQSGNVFGGQ